MRLTGGGLGAENTWQNQTGSFGRVDSNGRVGKAGPGGQVEQAGRQSVSLAGFAKKSRATARIRSKS
eukprot:7508775-Pyramimonas_sp.AAC.1